MFLTWISSSLMKTFGCIFLFGSIVSTLFRTRDIWQSPHMFGLEIKKSLYQVWDTFFNFPRNIGKLVTFLMLIYFQRSQLNSLLGTGLDPNWWTNVLNFILRMELLFVFDLVQVS